MEHTYAIIMAGGGGTRLWPVSRKERPKQHLPLIGEETLFQGTVQRLEGLFPPERILVVTVAEQVAEMQLQTPEIPAENYLWEPAPRGTASVVGLAAAILHKRDSRVVTTVLFSDHFFCGVMEKAEKVAVLPAGGLGWSNVGSWDSLFEVLLPDMDGNIGVNGQHLALETHNTLIYAAPGNNESLVLTIGVDDMVVVDAGDVLLTCKSDQSQKVRDVVAHLKKYHQERYL